MNTLVAILWSTWAGGFVWIVMRRQDVRGQAWQNWVGSTERPTLRPLKHGGGSLLLANVIARLQAGASVDSAWQGAFHDAGISVEGRVVDDEGVPTALADARLEDVAVSIAAACRLTRGIGAPLAGILESVLQTIDEVEAASRARKVAQAGPKTTARILSALPIVGMLATTALGVDVIGVWAKGGSVAWAALVGVLFWIVGILWLRHMIKAADERGRSSVDPVVMMDLLVASLRAGASIPHSLEALSVACKESVFGRCATMLRAGAPFEALEDVVDNPNHLQLVSALQPSWAFGASPTPLLNLMARRLRADRLAQAKAESERLAVRLVLPLGLCLLPAFVAIGVVPILTTISLPL